MRDKDTKLLEEAYSKISEDEIIKDVSSWKEAESILKDKGIDVARAYVHPVWNKALSFGDSDRSYTRVYFANSSAEEVAFWMKHSNQLFILRTPRRVNPNIMKSAEHPETSWTNPDSVKRAHRDFDNWNR